MTCNECFEAFSSALDGELEADQRASMTEHLEECADCRHLQTRMLALSAELKSQPFPEPGEAGLKKLAETALAEAQAVPWAWLRRGLRAPFEHWPLRTALRLLSFGGLILLLFQSLVVRYLLPAYMGMEAVSKKSFLDASDWPTWNPPLEALYGVSVLVLLVGLWTCGLPGFLLDLWSGTRLVKRDLIWLGLGGLCLGPVVALPLLAALEIGLYLFSCCLWAGLCLFATYLMVAFRTQRALPRLAIDFVGLTILLGLLEWVARAALRLPEPHVLRSGFSWLVGNLDFSSLVALLALLALSFLLLCAGLLGIARAYRSSGGVVAAGFFLALAFGGSLFALDSLPLSGLRSPSQTEFAEGRRVYLLGSTRANPWTLAWVSYPSLSVEGDSLDYTPPTARLRLAADFLDWDENSFLQTLGDWAQKAPGVTWGMVSVVDSLGERTQNVLAVASEARRKTVSQLLQDLHWRRLDDVVLSQHPGSVSGRLQGLESEHDGLRLRLIEVGESEGIAEAMARLEQEQEWVLQLTAQRSLELDSPFPSQKTAVADERGTFRFPRVPDGRYILALLLKDPINLTLNSSIPGIIEVSGGEVKLGSLRLTQGDEGTNVDLSASRWKARGNVLFSDSSEFDTARLASGASMTGFVDTKVFAGGEALLKLRVDGPPAAQGSVVAQFFTRDGRLVQEWSGSVSSLSDIDELSVDTQGGEGYLQLIIRAEQGPLTVRHIKLEVLSRG